MSSMYTVCICDHCGKKTVVLESALKEGYSHFNLKTRRTNLTLCHECYNEVQNLIAEWASKGISFDEKMAILQAPITVSDVGQMGD